MQRVDRPWSEYPAGTKAHAISGGHWIKLETGLWKWHLNGGAFPRPGGDALHVVLPGEEAEKLEPGEIPYY